MHLAAESDETAGLKLGQMGQEVTAAKGQRIVTQGESPEYFYIIKSGRVKVFRETEDRIRTDLTQLEAGSYFGEVALVTGQPRTASVEAAEETVLLKLSKDEFNHILDHNPQLARHIIQQLSRWLLEGDRRLETETVHQVKLRQISWFDFVLILGLSVILAVGFNFFNPSGIPIIQGWGETDNVPRMGLKEAFADYQAKNVVFVDARPTNFYKQRHIKGAINLPMPLFDFLYMMQLSQQPKDKPIIVYGHNISRHYDLDVARKLILRGHKKVFILGGGATDWQDLFPMELK
jgi:rhodanese-related sulfurtransferase